MEWTTTNLFLRNQKCNHEFFLQVSEHLLQRISQQRPNLWPDKWILQFDNATFDPPPPHTHKEKKTPVSEHLPYSFGLAPYDSVMLSDKGKR
jgi:hypothetical protein